MGVYRLIDVKNHEGISKADAHVLYKDRIGCLTQNIRKGTPKPDGTYCMRMDFIQDAAGKWIYRPLRTSIVSEVRELEGMLSIYTYNSIYEFAPATLMEPVYLDEANVIELYISDEPYTKFCKGFFYDENNVPHELVCNVHVGTFVDSCLIGRSGQDIVCRYFPAAGSIAFYDTIYGQQEYNSRILIHNTGSKHMRVSFDRSDAEWMIAPDSNVWITP